jgi:hypothetical protein
MLRHFLISLSCFLSACVHHRSFVATPFEPVTVKEKGDLSISTGVRPFKYYHLETTWMPLGFMAIRGGYGGFFKLDNFMASIILIKNYERLGLFLAPTYTYQHNIINRKPLRGILEKKKYTYNCEYSSPSLVLGVTIGDARSHQFILKTQYNIVQRYSYNYLVMEASASSYAITYNNEILDKRIPPFFSIELGYVFTEAINEKMRLKFQAGLNMVEHSFSHTYKFYAYRNEGEQTMVSRHPKYLGANIDIGVIFTGNTCYRRRDKAADP